MTDYGHDLQFGTFLTPDAAQPERVVELAALTEVAGLELATVQDHPYQARFLDVFSLLGAMLGRTTTLRVAPNVANLPLRPPYVLARTVASLDLLSRGRVELGLGAGAFWDAIVAAGGPRRTPGEALAALAEAVDVVRATWDTGQRSLRHEGAHYRVVGAHPGPAPAHDVEIWLGAIGPRMLALTGRVADGWLPSMSYVPPATLSERNARIDDAALAAGRDPVAVRRLYNVNASPGGGEPGLVGSATDWAEQLAGLVLEHGMSTFLLATDDPAAIRRFGDEVAPAVREHVDAARRGAAPADAAAVLAPAAPPTATASTGVPSGLGVRPTVDDGTRRSTEQPWDETTRPTYVPADPDRVYTAHEEATAQHLVDVHDHLRGELAQLFDVIGQVEAGSLDAGRARSLINTMTMRQNNWTLGAYCESYCRVVTTHHTIEDTSMFPHLRARDAALVPVIDRLEAEHHVIADVLDQVDRALVAVVSGPGGLPQLRAAVDLLADTMASHLAYEERMLLEPLARFGFA
ncbi:LLM class flavin-dependent oxidoreductase [Nocardioides sp. KIGAM211]|uniref:LLM class flavin-dependent oxidoreductase n=1 Tax=Nocardioides luti TaxID=2761101 RepID=A0A7X0VDC1_9ACTN|nr:LLM class flavin-dependent oxidoreductase [Nocardioides luti]MBB6629143.1 LLM class flavin-dependent oxidoreductase [Nocardioides luti]